jgi:4-amino-4-deoxy-L-arabinose transferase-like glycosyltransferase
MAVLLWSRYLQRPVDMPSWHEFDYSSIARNFVQEGNNILYPRIDWRRDGPGFTEMEFPLQPWLTAQIYRMWGIQEWLERLVPLAATLLALVVFCKLAGFLLPEAAAWLAALIFVVNRTTVFVASAIQPEALMLLFYLLAVYYFLRWMESRSWWMYAFAMASFAMAILMKSPAAHLGIFFFLLLLRRDGLALFKRWELWLFAALSLAPAAFWYSHAYSLWKSYHNSMGVSNEDHWIGLDILRRPKVVLGLLAIEAVFVLGVGGLVVIGFSLAKRIRREKAFQTAVLWLASVLIYYVVIIRTAGQYWAFYYHIVSVPAVALLMGAGLQRLNTRFAWLGGLAACVTTAAIFLDGGRADWSKSPGVLQDLLTPANVPAMLWLMVGSMSLLTLAIFVIPGAKLAGSAAGSVLLGGAFGLYLMVSGQLIRASWNQFAVRSAEFTCVACFADKIAPGALIVSTGGICQDATGHRLASDSPEFFYWLQRKGFSTCEGEQSAAQLREFARRGARYFVAKKAAVREQPMLEQALKTDFRLLGECKTAWLFELGPG